MAEGAQADPLSRDSYVMQRLFIGMGEGFNLKDDADNLLLMAREDHLSLGTYVISRRDGGIVGKTRPRGSISSHVFEMLDGSGILLGSIGFDPSIFTVIEDEATLSVNDTSGTPIIEIKGNIFAFEYEFAASGRGDTIAKVGGEEQEGVEQNEQAPGPKDSYRIQIFDGSMPTIILIGSAIIIEQIAAQRRRIVSTMPRAGGGPDGPRRMPRTGMGPDFHPAPITRVGGPGL